MKGNKRMVGHWLRRVEEIAAERVTAETEAVNRARLRVMLGRLRAELILWVVLLCLALPVMAQEVGTKQALLQWDYATNDLQYVSGFRVYVVTNGLGPVTNTVQVKVVSVPATNTVTAVGMFDVLGGLENGVYGLYATAVGKTDLFEPVGVESMPTETLWVWWYGRPPKPGKPVMLVRQSSSSAPPLPQ